jgi:hypothetical protein
LTPNSGRTDDTGRTAEAFGPYRSIVDIVHDGDTVNAKLDVGFDLTVYTRIRIDGINAPELSTQEGKDVSDFVRTLLCAGRRRGSGQLRLGQVQRAHRRLDQAARGPRLRRAMLDTGHAAGVTNWARERCGSRTRRTHGSSPRVGSTSSRSRFPAAK